MKYFYLLTVFIVFISCGTKETKELNLFDPEIFTLSMGDNLWESTFKVKVEGFEQVEENDRYSVHLVLTIDLLNEKGEEMKSFGSTEIKEAFTEKQEPYINMEIAKEMNVKGKYSANFIVVDKLKDKKITIKKEFEVK